MEYKILYAESVNFLQCLLTEYAGDGWILKHYVIAPQQSAAYAYTAIMERPTE